MYVATVFNVESQGTKGQGPQQGGKFMKRNAAMVGQGVKFAMSIQDILLESDDEDNVRSVVIADDIADEGTAGNVEGEGTASLMEDSTFSEENSSDYLSIEDGETEVLHEDSKFVCAVGNTDSGVMHWRYDSACTDHCTNNRSIMQKFVEYC